MNDVIVVGGGAAGMMAAISAAQSGNNVTIFEKNDKLGKKLFITGKGRCNITNSCDLEDIFSAIVTNKKFMYSSIYGFSNYDTIDFFENIGLKTKVERGGRVFPLSDHSSDVINVLSTRLKRLGVKVNLSSPIKGLIIENEIDDKKVVKGVIVGNMKYFADKVIIATGGKSYPLTGSTGDGYNWARECGHTIVDIKPSLAPIEVKEELCKDLMGLTLKNVEVSFYSKKKNVYSIFGELLFTHFGVSGPTILKASSYLHKYINDNLIIKIDLKNALSETELDERILKDFSLYNNKILINGLNDLLPKRIIPYVIEQSGIDQYKRINSISREERLSLVNAIKKFQLSAIRFRDFNEAIITKGGISTKEINPQTMESKLVSNLFFVGEILDVDAITGGYNLQIAWSTGYAVGTNL